MTAQARDNRDQPFSDWLRRHPDLDSNRYKLDVSDIDFVFHKWKSQADGIGTRKVKLLMDVEVKTFGRLPNFNQLETLYFRHLLLDKKQKLFSNYLKEEVTVWHFGQYVLVLHDGNRPDECSKIEWCKFSSDGDLKREIMTEKRLIQILKLDIRPDDGQLLTLRRHHKTTEFGFIDRSPELLFPIAKHVIKRS